MANGPPVKLGYNLQSVVHNVVGMGRWALGHLLWSPAAGSAAAVCLDSSVERPFSPGFVGGAVCGTRCYSFDPTVLLLVGAQRSTVHPPGSHWTMDVHLVSDTSGGSRITPKGGSPISVIGDPISIPKI